MDKIELTNPYWIRVIGWVFLPVMLCLGFWCLLLPVWYERYEIGMFFAAGILGGGNIYMTIHAMRTLPFMNSLITLTEDKINVQVRGKCCTVRWTDISKVKHIASTQVLHVYGPDGKRFLSVTEQLKGFHLLTQYLSEKSGFKV